MKKEEVLLETSVPRQTMSSPTSRFRRVLRSATVRTLKKERRIRTGIQLTAHHDAATRHVVGSCQYSASPHVSLSLCASVCSCLSLSLSVFLHLSLLVCLSISVALPLPLPLCMSASVSVRLCVLSISSLSLFHLSHTLCLSFPRRSLSRLSRTRCLLSPLLLVATGQPNAQCWRLRDTCCNVLDRTHGLLKRKTRQVERQKCECDKTKIITPSRDDNTFK